MSLQYLRRAHLTIGNGSQSIGFTGDEDGDDRQLRFRFEVRQNNNSTPNVADIFITNVKQETAEKVKQEFKQITLSAGYRGNERIIFKGEIFQVRYGRENITDTYLHILAKSGHRARNLAVVSKTLAAGHTFRDRVDVATKAMAQFGITVGQIDDLGSKKFSRGFTCFGEAKSLLREIGIYTKTSWSIQNNVFQMIKNDGHRKGPITVLNSQTGLIGLPVQTIQGIEGQCLLNADLVPDGLVQINESSIQQAALSPGYRTEGTTGSPEIYPHIAADGVYKLFLVDHVGDSRGQAWYTEFVGIRNGDPISAALAQRGIGPPST